MVTKATLVQRELGLPETGAYDQATIAALRRLTPAESLSLARKVLKGARERAEVAPKPKSINSSWRSIVKRADVEKLVIDEATRQGVTGASLRNLLANIAIECGFQPTRESHRYDPALAQKRFSALKRLSLPEISALVRAGAPTFFEAVYGARTRKGGQLRNVRPGDGYKYRGAGLIQLTGRGMFSECAAALGREDILTNPDVLVSDVDLSVRSAIWYWRTYVESTGRAGDPRAAAKAVNPGEDPSNRVAISSKYKEIV